MMRVLALFLCLPSLASAQDAIKVELIPKAQQGQSPLLVVKAQVPLRKVTLEVKRSTDGKTLKAQVGPLDGGRKHEFPLTMTEVGSAKFVGTLSVATAAGDLGTMPLDVATELLPPLAVTVAPSDVDLADRVLRFSASRPLSRAQITLMADTGTPLGTEEVSFADTERYEIRWSQPAGNLMRITLTAWDADGFFGGVDLFPWRIDIPHEELNFASGSFEIEAGEAPKLEASFTELGRAIDRYGKLATIKLYIAGHTDTVGDAASNRTLSNNRARAIGRWFKKRGVRIPIFTVGMGEDRPLVNTPDETDERRNRRAEYIVAVDAPTMSQATWKPLE